MPDEAATNDLDVYCMICCKSLGDDDDIHFFTGPYGFDLDVVCGSCMDRIKPQQAGPDAAGESAQAELESLIDPINGGWGDAGL